MPPSLPAITGDVSTRLHLSRGGSHEARIDRAVRSTDIPQGGTRHGAADAGRPRAAAPRRGRGPRHRPQHHSGSLSRSEPPRRAHGGHPHRRRHGPGLPDGRDSRRPGRVRQPPQPVHAHDESRAHRHRRHRARARLQGRVRVAVGDRSADARGREGRGLHPFAAEGLPVGPDDEPLRAGHHGVGAPLLGRPAAGERLLSSGQGHARAHLHERRGSLGRARVGADRHRAARRRGLAAAPPRPTRVRERGGLPARPGQDGGHAHRRRCAQHGPGGRLLPRRGVHLRRHQDQARASGRAGGAHQRPPLRPQGQRERSAGRRGEQRVRPRQRHERVRGLGTLQPVQPGRRVQSRRPRARAGLDHQRCHAVPACGGRGLGSRAEGAATTTTS